jgi:hypothetical protein
VASRHAEPTSAQLAAVARNIDAHTPDRELRARASAAIDAVQYANLDGELALSYVLWPTENVLAAEAATRRLPTVGLG